MIFRILLVSLCPFFFSFNSLALDDGYRLYLNISEGGEISKRRLNNLKEFLNLNQCPISDIETGIQNSSSADFIFNPLKFSVSNEYKKFANIQLVNNEPLTTSILVRGSTGITELGYLDGVRIAYLSEHSITGFEIPQAMLLEYGIKLNTDRITFAQTNVGALSLLLHKDVFAAAVATPLANKWAGANDLNVVAVSHEIKVGGLWANKKIAIGALTYCQIAFDLLSIENSGNKNILKVFPAWISRFKSIKLSS